MLNLMEFVKSQKCNFLKNIRWSKIGNYLTHSLFLFCHLPFLAGILVFSTLHLGLTSMRATASYLYEGLAAAANNLFLWHLNKGHLECAAPKCWLKYTTHAPSGIRTWVFKWQSTWIQSYALNRLAITAG